ncbi:MAG: hypothetical protein WCO09_00555 [bacterium]
MKAYQVQGALATSKQLKRAEHLVELFDSPEYGSLQIYGEEIKITLSECRAFEKSSKVICRLLGTVERLAPHVRISGYSTLLKAMRKAKGELADHIRAYQQYP